MKKKITGWGGGEASADGQGRNVGLAVLGIAGAAAALWLLARREEPEWDAAPSAAGIAHS